MEKKMTVEESLSEVLDNLLGLLLLEGSYEIEENEDSISVVIETADAGRVIGSRGESLESLQLLVNQMMSRKVEEGKFKRVILDVSGWRKQKEEELKKMSQDWGNQVLESGKDLELEPMSAWQRRVIHMVVGEMKGLETESVGEGRDRHVVIKVKSAKGKVKSRKEESETDVKTEES